VAVSEAVLHLSPPYSYSFPTISLVFSYCITGFYRITRGFFHPFFFTHLKAHKGAAPFGAVLLPRWMGIIWIA
jgi:hypothetical protein